MSCSKVSSNELQNSQQSLCACPKAAAITALALAIMCTGLALLGHFNQLPLPRAVIVSAAGSASFFLATSATLGIYLACHKSPEKPNLTKTEETSSVEPEKVSEEELQARNWAKSSCQKVFLNPGQAYIHEKEDGSAILLLRQRNSETVHVSAHTSKVEAEQHIHGCKLIPHVPRRFRCLYHMWTQWKEKMQDNAAQIFRSCGGSYILLDTNQEESISRFPTYDKALAALHEKSQLEDSELPMGASIDAMIYYLFKDFSHIHKTSLTVDGTTLNYVPEVPPHDEESVTLAAEKVWAYHARRHALLSFLDLTLNKDEKFLISKKQYFTSSGDTLSLRTIPRGTKKPRPVAVHTLFSRMDDDKARTYFRQLQPKISEAHLEIAVGCLLQLKDTAYNSNHKPEKLWKKLEKSTNCHWQEGNFHLNYLGSCQFNFEKPTNTARRFTPNQLTLLRGYINDEYSKLGRKGIANLEKDGYGIQISKTKNESCLRLYSL